MFILRHVVVPSRRAVEVHRAIPTVGTVLSIPAQGLEATNVKKNSKFLNKKYTIHHFFWLEINSLFWMSFVQNYTTVDPKQLHKSHIKFLRQARTTDTASQTSRKTSWETRPETRETQDQGGGHSNPAKVDTLKTALRTPTVNCLGNKLADWETRAETRPGSRTQHPRLKNKLADWETRPQTRQRQDQGAGHSIPGWRTSWQTGRQVGRQDRRQDQGAGHSIPGWKASWETGRQVGRQDPRQDEDKTMEADTASQPRRTHLRQHWEPQQ